MTGSTRAIVLPGKFKTKGKERRRRKKNKKKKKEEERRLTKSTFLHLIFSILLKISGTNKLDLTLE